MQPGQGRWAGERLLLAACVVLVAATIGLMALLDVLPPDRGFETIFVPSVGGMMALAVTAVTLHRSGRRGLAWRVLLGVPVVVAVVLMALALVMPGGIS